MSALPLPADLSPADLPVPPEAALRVVQACADSAVTGRELADLVGRDPRLTAELLRTVNSAYFGLAREVASVRQAVNIIGHRALRSLVLCLSVRDALRGHAIPAFDSAGFTEDSLRRAVAARCLGEAAGLNPEECFTVGLLLDFGLLALFQTRPEHASVWPELRALDPEQRHRREFDLFGMRHDAVAGDLGAAWSLPVNLVSALSGHHQDPGRWSPEHAPLCSVALGADWVAAIFTAADKAATLARCEAALSEHLALDGDALRTLLERVVQSTAEAARSLGMRVAEQPSVDGILREANLCLAEQTLSYQEITWHLRKTLAERDRLAAELQHELELAREIQRSLLPADGEGPVVGINLPARQVSGDFYDHFRLPDGRACFAVADVSGKGMNAALLMAKTVSLFRCLGKRLADPAKLLGAINEELCETSVRGMFVTMVAGIYDPRLDLVRLVNAGNPPGLYLRPDGQPAELAASAPPLGVLPDIHFQEAGLRLNGGTLYVFTDGLTESAEARRGTPDTDRLAQVLSSLSHLPLRTRLRRAIEQLHPPDRPLADDLTLVAVCGGP